MIKQYWLIIGLISLTIFVKFCFSILKEIRKKNVHDLFSGLRNAFIKSIVIGTFLFPLFSIIDILENYNHTIITMLLYFVVVAIIPSYDFIIQPIIDSLFNKNEIITNSLIYKSNLYKIRLINYSGVNAFASGILLFTKNILLSKELYSKMSQKSIQGIVFHEEGHLKNNHLLLMYVANLLGILIFFFSSRFFYPIINSLDSPDIWIVVHAMSVGLFIIFIPAFLQRHLEYRADAYAANEVGCDNYIMALKELNVLTDNGLEKSNLYYPTLEQRISNVRKTSK